MWDKLYNAAVKVQNSRKISPFIDAGGVAAAILTKQGNIYVGYASIRHVHLECVQKETPLPI